MSKTGKILAGVFAFACLISAQPDFEIHGYFDSDVWTDFSGNFYTNDELDFGFSAFFTDKVSLNVYTTVAGGSVPAGAGEPGDRWVSLAFDGIDVTIETKAGDISAGDLVYQYGCFDYYLYKRLSMITPESFARGVSLSFGNDMINQSVIIGASDAADDRSIEYSFVDVSAGDTVTVEAESASPVDEGNAGSITGATEFSFGDSHSAGLYYSIISDMKKGFENSGVFYSGIEYSGSLGEKLALKLDYSFTKFGGSDYTMGLLFEPVFTSGKFSTALSFYRYIDPEELGIGNPVGDEMYIYVEPGISLSDAVGVGLPLEIHTADTDNFSDASEFWAVPTLYIYPAEGIEWWIWAQVIVPFDGDSDMGYALGSEIIAEF